MSRKDEDRILHGLHYYRESIDEEFTVSGDQLLWLAAHSYADGVDWCRGGEPQRFDSSVIAPQFRRKLFMSKVELPLRYLQYRRLIKLNQAGEDIDVAVTFAGADRAMRLHTRSGRMEIWYREHKDGVLGVLVTICVALMTALCTAAVVERLHRNVAEPPRIIYEVNPREPGR